MDTIPPKKFWPKKYYRQGGYVCVSCPYAEDKVCGNCVFAKWNVEGVLAGFSPKEAYRQAHAADVDASPLMQQLAKTTPLERGAPSNQVLPKVRLPFFPVPSHNSIAQSLSKLRTIRRQMN